MSKRYWLKVGTLFMVLTVALALTSQAYGQAGPRKRLPTITLIKTQGGPNDVLSDPLLSVPEAAPGGVRYFLLPVYIKNCLDSITYVVGNAPPVTYVGEPIYSFKFKIQYDNKMLKAIGVQKTGPLPVDTAVVAKNFNISWDIDLDTTYKKSTVGVSSANGERIMVTGSSSIPLPLTRVQGITQTPIECNPAQKDTAVFMYIVFKVVGSATTNPIKDQLIIPLDSIAWNNYAPFGSDTNGVMLGRLFAPFQEGVAPTRITPITYPNNYGMSEVQLTERPRLDLFPTSQVTAKDVDQTSYELNYQMQTQYGNNNYIYRRLLLSNGVPGSVLRNVIVSTDEPWLRIDTNDIPPNGPGVGPGGVLGERGVTIRQISQITNQKNFNVVCNPSLIPNRDGNGYPTPGVYTGYVSIRTDEARNSTVRLKVVLLVNRNPLEPGLNDASEPTNPKGIQMLFRNSRSGSQDTTYLTFGTGINATDNADTLFGETVAGQAAIPNDFFARFYPPSLGPTFKGLIDTRGYTPRPSPGHQDTASSMDIRNYRVDTTIVYCVKFSAGSPASYPVVIEYDTRDFPNGAQLFIRDAVNGTNFNEDMRKTTSMGGFRRAFFIRDPNITSFCIEYTTPRVVQFPEINTGWNLVSMPVRPSDPRSNIVFPNAASVKPIRFTQNQYVNEDTVQVGVGYFVKYGTIIDKTVAGTKVKEINEQTTPFVVRLYQGWNTVGGLSVNSSTDPACLSFGPIAGGASPKLAGDVYRYLTSRGYEQTSLIIPGYGYWMKVDRDGFYRLQQCAAASGKAAPAGSEVMNSLNRLSVSDAGQKVGTVYFGHTSMNVDESRFELPPVPPSDMFDVRFSNNGCVSAANTFGTEHTLRIQGVQYPVVLSVSNPEANYSVIDAATGQVLGTFTRGQAGAVRVTNPMTQVLKIVSAGSSTMELGSAIPNPVSSRASFELSVTSEQQVSVKLFSAVGKEVKTLFSGIVNGRQVVDFTTEELPAGVYYYKMTTSGGFTQVRQIVVSK